MGRKVLLAVTVLTVFLGYLGYKLNEVLQPPPLPKLENTWWGPGKAGTGRSGILPFNISISDEALKDLKWRLDHHRPFIPPLKGIAQEYGMNTNLLKEIVDFWRTKYDWKKREEYLNQYAQYFMNIQGLDIHVLHVNPKKVPGIKVYPLLLLHGWPGSLREFYEFIPILTSPQEGKDFMFEVIAPHIPGYGYSQPAVRPGLGAAQVAVVFKNLMNELGFKKFYTQGGDFGAIILQHMAVLFPENVLGFHSNMCTILTPKSYLRTLISAVFPSWYMKPEHYDRVFPLKEKFTRRIRETGYLHLQATKPDTLGVAMDDSPVGLAAYILEKFTTGTNHTWQQRMDGGLKDQYTYTNLLDNVMIYWVTRSATTAFRLYSETFNSHHMGLGILRNPVTVPAACARFKYDFYTADGLLDEIYPNLLHLSDYEGGHFAAFQLPDVLAKDVFIAVDKFIKYNNGAK